MRDRVRVGVVGTSWWADALPLPSLKSHPRAEIAAICGRTRPNAERLAQKYEIPRVVTDYRELIGHGDLDALVIITPDDQHHAIALDALDAGLHVLCEKPLAPNAVHASAMYARAQAAGVKHMTMFTNRWLPQYQYLRELVEQGYLGRCYQASFTFRGHYARSAGYSWRFDRRRANGVLGDLGSHMIDLARWQLGEVARVSAHLTAFTEQRGPDEQPIEAANDSAMLLLELVSGAQVSIQVSALAQPIGGRWQQHVALYGEAGSLEAGVLRDAGAVADDKASRA